MDWLDKNKAELIIDMEEINQHGGTLLRDNLKEISVIDLAFSIRSQCLASENWRYISHTGSDHEAISFDIFAKNSCHSQTLTNPESALGLPSCFNYKKADWKKFAIAIQRETKNVPIPEFITQNTLDSLAENFTSSINTAAESAIPRARPCERSKPWWTNELNTLRKSLHSALRTYKRTRKNTDLVLWKAARNKYFHTIRETKTKHWEEFLANAVGKEVFVAARYTRPAINTRIPSLKTSRAQANTFTEKCEALLSTLFPSPLTDPSDLSSSTDGTTFSQYSTYLYPLDNLEIQLHQKDSTRPQRPASPTSKDSGDQTWPWHKLSPKEVKSAIKSSSPSKAPGPDRIGFAILQQAYKVVPAIFNQVYSVLFEYGYHPKCWRKGIGVVFPKPKKEEY